MDMHANIICSSVLLQTHSPLLINHSPSFLLTTGRMGSRCERVCTHYNPCDGSSTCRDWSSSIHGYTCVCPKHRSGQYCDEHLDEVCPATWWGHPICGPCNCPTLRGFDHSCDKMTGECYCKVGYFAHRGLANDAAKPRLCQSNNYWLTFSVEYLL